MSDKKRCCCSAEDVIVPGDLWKDIVEFIKARDPARSTVTWFELENWRQAILARLQPHGKDGSR